MMISRERFFAKVDKNGPIPAHCPELGPCHLWTASRNPKGYGRFNCGDGPRQAHRVAFFLAHGRWPEPCALHHCDNPPCVNPAHLFEGTNADNMLDKNQKGRARAARHAEHGKALLSTRQAVEIRCLSGVIPQRRTANIYSCSRSTVSRIQSDDIWNP